MIYIRTDANEVIATGHVMRCLTIADELKKIHKKVVFVVSDQKSAELIEKKDYPIIITHVKWNDVDIEQEYSIFKSFVKKTDLMLVDSYYLNSEYLTIIKNIMQIATFDDLFSEKKDADIIINYNVFYRKFNYKERYAKEKCTLLLGEKYVPLREQFRKIKPELEPRKNSNKVLLMCGGADKIGLIFGVLQYIKKCNQELFLSIEWKIVIGKYYTNKNKLEQESNKFTNIEVLHNVENMANLMHNCDLCITAASTVLYECCAMLLPTIFCIVAEDQEYDAVFFKKGDMMLYCGDYMRTPDKTLENIKIHLEDLIYDMEMQRYMKIKMQSFIDGKGAERIANSLVENISGRR